MVYISFLNKKLSEIILWSSDLISQLLLMKFTFLLEIIIVIMIEPTRYV